MSTRYSLPSRPSGRDDDPTDVARGARSLAALAVVLSLLGFLTWAVIVPPEEPPVAAGSAAEPPASASTAALHGA